MTWFRRRIAERLVEAKNTAALLTTFNEVDMSAVIGIRQQYHEAFQERYNAKLGFMSFFVKAAIESLKACPELNAEIRDNNIVYRNFYDISIAVGGGKGLVVPVLRNAELLSFAEIEQAIGDFAARAKSGQLKPDELMGGTSRSPTAASSARCFPRRSSIRRKAASWGCTPCRTGPSPATARSSSAR